MDFKFFSIMGGEYFTKLNINSMHCNFVVCSAQAHPFYYPSICMKYLPLDIKQATIN